MDHGRRKRVDQGRGYSLSLGFVNLEGSPHYWKKKTVGMSLTKSGNKYEPKIRWIIGTTKLI